MNKIQEHVLSEASLFVDLCLIREKHLPEHADSLPDLMSKWFWLMYQDVNKMHAEY